MKRKAVNCSQLTAARPPTPGWVPWALKMEPRPPPAPITWWSRSSAGPESETPWLQSAEISKYGRIYLGLSSWRRSASMAAEPARCFRNVPAQLSPCAIWLVQTQKTAVSDWFIRLSISITVRLIGRMFASRLQTSVFFFVIFIPWIWGKDMKTKAVVAFLKHSLAVFSIRKFKYFSFDTNIFSSLIFSGNILIHTLIPTNKQL